MREAKRLVVTEQLIREVVHEVAPVVSEATGWPLEIRALGHRVLPRDRGYEEVLLARIKGAGIDLGDAPKRGLLERLLEYVVEGTVLAAYEPSTSELLVVRENVDDSNLDGLRLVVAHELVHRGQHVNHGELFAQVDAAVRAAFEGFLPGGGGVCLRAAARHGQGGPGRQPAQELLPDRSSDGGSAGLHLRRGAGRAGRRPHRGR